MKRRALFFWPLLLAFTASSLLWLVWAPSSTNALYRAIPASATFLGVHRDLSGRWDALSSNPLLLALLESLGTEPSEVERLRDDPGFRELLRLLGSDELVLAYVPRMRSSGESAWVFAAPLGGQSQRLRWMLKSGKMPDCKRAATRNGWLVWVWAPRELKGQRIAFALVEGQVVGCIASGTLGIDEVLGCVDGNFASLANRPERLPAETPVADRGWYRNEQGQRFPYEFALTPAGGLQASVQTPWRMPPAEGLATGVVKQLAGWADLVGGRSVAAAAFDPALMRDWVRTAFTNAVGREVADLLAMEGAGPSGMALLGGDYSGRFMAVRLPTLVAGVAGSSSNQLTQVTSALDRLNALTRWGLVSSPVMAGSVPLYVIEATDGGLYGGLAHEENLAYTPTEDGLVWSSNLSTLERLVKEQAAGWQTNAQPWRAELDRLASGQARGFLWFDAAEGAKVVRLGVTAWSLKLLLEDPEGTQATRQRMNDFKAWMDTLSPLGHIAVGWEDRNGQATITLHAGDL